jgi:hypothetical protein
MSASPAENVSPQHKPRSRFRGFLWFLLVLAAVGLMAWGWYKYSYAPRRDFERLLDGDENVAITAIRIRGHGKYVFLDDPVSVNYLSKMFRSAKRRLGRPGMSYEADVYLAAGGPLLCGLSLPKANDHFSISFPIDSLTADPTGYLIFLSEPMPEPLADVLAQLPR